MGRKLDLSTLTDEEAKHVWEVVQRDFDLRKKEEERLEVVKTGSLDWYYKHVKARFKHFGSAKVMRSLYGRLQPEHGSSPALGLQHRSYSLPDVNSGAQLSPTGGSGESEQTSEDEALGGTEAQHLSREKRLLSVHPFDFEVDSDCSAQSCPQSLQLSPAPSTLDSLQTLSDAPHADHEEAASQKDAFIPDASLSPEAQDLLKEQGYSSPEVSLPFNSSLERKPSPEGTDQPQVQYFADTDTSDEDVEEAHKMEAHLPHHSKRRSWASSQESAAPPETQSFGPQPHTDADIEEEALKRKLGELTSKVSDKEGSSEEEEEAQSGLSSGRSSVPGTEPSEAQQVSDIKSRIAALSAAGLPVKTWEKPRKKSNLQIFPLQPPTSSLRDEDPELPEANKVMARPHVQRRILNNSLKLQDRVEGPFSRKSAYRGSLTQRNPNGKNRRVDHIFAKPVMTHQP